MTQHADKEGFLPSSQDTRGTGEYGQSCTLIHHGFQEWILAGVHGPGVTAIHHIHGWQPRFLWVYEDALLIEQCATTFQYLMQNTLGEVNLTYCVIYLDDVILFGHTEEEHLGHLRVVLEHFRELNLKMKLSKCSFFQTEIVYLTHHVSKEGICLSEENVHAIMEFPMPETYTEVRAFCGLSGHYWHFIRNFVCLAHALYDLLGDEIKMGPVTLTPEAEEVVWVLKEKILSAPVLVFPDFDKPFLLETDASKEGLGAVLSQKQDDGCYYPVAFGSRTLMPS